MLILVLAISTLMVMATGIAAATPPDHTAHPDKAPKHQKAPSVNVERVAPAPKVAVCHRTGNGEFHLISISSNAIDAHIAHGDAVAGEGSVPGMPTFEFDEDCAVYSTKVVEGSFSGRGIDIAFKAYMAFDDAVSGMGSYSYSVNGRTMDVEVIDVCLDDSALTATVWGSGDPSWQDGDGFMVLTLVDTGGGSMATRALFFDNEAEALAAFASQCATATAGASGGTGFLTFF
jgi:hypothetical protein